jgi:hypothetical protein
MRELKKKHKIEEKLHEAERDQMHALELEMQRTDPGSSIHAVREAFVGGRRAVSAEDLELARKMFPKKQLKPYECSKCRRTHVRGDIYFEHGGFADI